MFFPSFDTDILMCIPEPFTPYLGFGIKLANSPNRFAMVLTASLKVIILSAVARPSL